MVANSEKPVRDQWAADLKALDEDTKKRFQKSFSACSAAQQDEIMAEMAAGEPHPSTKLEHFFVRLKRMTINGYYTSKIGIHQDLQYKATRRRRSLLAARTLSIKLEPPRRGGRPSQLALTPVR